MRRSVLTLKHLYSFVKSYLQRIENTEPVKRRGRPKTFEEALIVTLWLYQTLYKLSYREVLEIAKHEGFHVPVLGDYHYRVKKLDEGVLKKILEESTKHFFRAKWDFKYLIVDGTGFGFGSKYTLNWMRGTQVREVSSHVRLVSLVGVDEEGRAIILGCEVGGPYASEVNMLREILDRIKELPRKPFIADRGYDAVDVIERVMKFGCEPAIGMKQSWRMRIRNSLRRMSFENWGRYRKKRNRIEGVFGSMKLKVGSSFTLIREDLAKKMAIACAILWNLYMIVLQTLCYFVMVLKMVRKW